MNFGGRDRPFFAYVVSLLVRLKLVVYALVKTPAGRLIEKNITNLDGSGRRRIADIQWKTDR